MSSPVRVQALNLEKLRSHAMRGKWSEVFEMCKLNKALYKMKITGTGDTVLHMAVSDGQEKVVANIVDFLVLEEDKNLAQNNVVIPVDGDEVENWSMNIVFGAENDRKNTPLHLAAVKGNVEMCKKIGIRDLSLIARRNVAGETPLFLAALYGRKEAFLWLHYLYMEGPGVPSIDLAHRTRDNNDTILHCAIAEGHFDVAIEIVHLYKDHMKEMMRRNKEGLSPLHLLAAKRSAFKTTALLEQSFLVHPIYESLIVDEKNRATTLEELQKKNKKNSLVNVMEFINGLLQLGLLYLLLVFFGPVPSFHDIRKMKEKHTWSLQIMNELLHHCSDEDISQIISRTASEQLSISQQREQREGFNESESRATPLSGGITIDTPLMIAAKNGVVDMVDRILELFPSRVKDVNAEGKNIVLLAVECRQTELFRFLCKQKWLSESLFGQVDKDGNNALHLAAKLGSDIDWLNPGEINWFEYVTTSMPRGLSGRYNRKMKTPEDIFRESHKEHMKSEAEWVAKTSQACSVVSTLVLSVVFATCTTVPGGYDANGGYAILRNKSAFKNFACYSYWALFCSLMSTIIFLSIVASRSQSFRSWRSVCLKLCHGMSFMFSSIVCLWLSFCAAVSFTDDDETAKSDDLRSNIFVSFWIIFLIVTQLPTFIGPILSSNFQISACRRKATPPIEYRRTKNEGISTDSNN